jgi:hypothetical protein
MEIDEGKTRLAKKQNKKARYLPNTGNQPDPHKNAPGLKSSFTILSSRATGSNLSCLV